MRKLITTAAAATLLLAGPLAAFAGDQGHGYGGWGPPQSHGWKHGHGKHGYWRGAPSVYYPAAPVYFPAAPVYVPAPRVVVPPPVYVPAPVVAVPAPYPYPQGPVGNVSIGFRFFF